MILIVGSSHDDVLYFDSRLKNRKEETFLNNRKVIIGELLGQEICLSFDNYSSYMTSAIVTYLVSHFNIFMVINVGYCRVFSDDLKPRSIVISDATYLGDVNFTMIDQVKVGQIPGLADAYYSDIYLVNLFMNMSERLGISNTHRGTFVSMNNMISSKEEIKKITSGNTILGRNENVVIDSESGGCAIGSALNDVPFIAVKVVISKINNNIYTDELIKVLKEYVSVGKIVIAAIGEIGRNDTKTIKTN